MIMSRIRQLMVLFGATCCLAVSPACHKETEQDKVRKVITGVEEAANEKDIKKIIAGLSKTYQDPQGFDYNSIKGLLLGYFFRHQKVRAYIPDMSITVDGISAKAEFQAVLTGDRAGSAAILPESLGVYAFEVLFRKEENAWKVISARWNRAGEGKE